MTRGLKTNPILFRPGDWVVCEDGHRNLKAVTHVFCQDICRSIDFEDARGRRPTGKSIAIGCETCGKPYFRASQTGTAVRPVAIERDGKVFPWIGDGASK